MDKNNSSKYCKSCNLVYNNFYDNLCIFCSIVNNHKDNHKNIYSYVIGVSKLSQKEIIINTHDFIMKNNRIPLPKELDNNCKIIDENPFIFMQVKNAMNESDKNIFNNFIIFFTDTINIKLIKNIRIFDKVYKNKKNIDIDYDFSDLETEIYNNYYDKFITDNKHNLINLFI